MFGFKYKEFRIIALLIPVVGIIIALLYGSNHIANHTSKSFFYMVHSILVTAGIWMGCYAIVTYLWRKFPWEREPLKHILIEIFAILFYVSFFGLLVYTFSKKFNLVPEEIEHNISFSMDVFMTLLITFFITSIHEAVFFYQQWKVHFSKSARLEKDNIEAKYETLKSQINPHFLFNSLNSLSLIVDNNNEATHYIQNLSEFLRYVLKSRDKELVLVRDEIQILERYFSLQKSRFRENLNITLNVDEKFYHYALPPLVLQMLVENCIKHNIISKDKPLSINITAQKDHIIIKNNLQKKKTESSTKLGLKNITDRFAFFTSNEVYIEETNTYFKVSIPLLTVEL